MKRALKWFKTYILKNCFLLTIPILVWNVIFYDKLPPLFQEEFYWDKIPTWLVFAENTTRIFTFILISFLGVTFDSQSLRNKLGWVLYTIGTLVYFLSWVALFDNNDYTSQAILFEMGPSITPFIWLIGIGILSKPLHYKLQMIKWPYYAFTVLFLLFHNLHAVYSLLIW
ncbi:MAG: hypothetical protein ACPGLV_04040 [Bacteroidia bacterium]